MRFVARFAPSFARRLGALPLATALLLFLGSGAALAQPLKVEALTRKANGVPLSFPWVSGPDEAVAQRINHWIFLQHFDELRVPARREDGVKSVPKDIGTLIFGVGRNDARVLSLVIRGEYCGAYCETFERADSFDVLTGRRLSAPDLLTPAGLQKLGREMQQRNANAIGSMLTKLRQRSRKEEGQDDAIAMYESCLKTTLAATSNTAWLFANMALLPDEINFGQGRCSSHATRALDKLFPFINRFPIASLGDALTPYGRHLLGGEAQVSAPATPFGQVMNGSLDNKLPVVLQLNTPAEDGSVSGAYFYTRYRQPIHLAGTWKGGVLSLDEHGDGGSSARWTLRPEGRGWRGEWKQGSRTLPVRLSP